MKKTWIIPVTAVAITLTACGGSETKEETTTTDTTAVVEVVEEPKELVKDYDYFAAKLDNMSIEGYTLTKDLVNDDTTYKTLRRSWTLDPAVAGFDKIQINSTDLSTSTNRAESEHKSLEEFQTFETKYLKEADKKNVSDFKEYTKDSLTFYYCTFQHCKDTFGPSDFRKVYFTHCTGNLKFFGWVYLYDKNQDILKAEEMALKMMDFLAQP